MRRVILHSQARADVVCILSYLEAHRGYSSRRKFLAAFEQSCSLLATHPRIGQREPVMDSEGFEVRRLVMDGFRNYLIFYMPTDSTIRVIRILHGARDPGLRLNAPAPHD